MRQAIRSEIDKHLISLCCRVILNLARYEPTKENAFQVSTTLTKLFTSTMNNSTYTFCHSFYIPTDFQFRDCGTNIGPLVRQGLRYLQHSMYCDMGVRSMSHQESGESLHALSFN